MRLENSLEVPAAPADVWRYMLDVERVALCVPGAELTEVIDDRTWKGKVQVKLGPVSLSFAGTVVVHEKDEAAHRAVLKAEGRETKGKGTARADVVSTMEPTAGGGTHISFVTELTISGPMAQYGRGMIVDVSRHITDQFAACVGEQLSGSGRTLPAQEPIAGIRLGLWTLVRAVGRFFVRAWGALGGIFRRRPPSRRDRPGRED